MLPSTELAQATGEFSLIFVWLGLVGPQDSVLCVLLDPSSLPVASPVETDDGQSQWRAFVAAILTFVGWGSRIPEL